MVGNVADLLGIERRARSAMLGGGGNSADEHAVIEDSALSCTSEGQLGLLAGVEIEDSGLFGNLRISDTVSIDWRGCEDAERSEVAMIRVGRV